MHYNVILGPRPEDPPELKSVKSIHEINSLVQMGEEPDEIEYEVKKYAPMIVGHFASWMKAKKLFFIPGFLESLAESFIFYVYLDLYEEIYPKKISLFRVAKKYDQAFIDKIGEEVKNKEGREDKEYLEMIRQHLSYFRLYLKEMKVVYEKTFQAIIDNLVARNKK